MPITLDGSNGITTPTYGGADTSEYLVPVTAFKNRLINSDMRIDQRNAGASVTLTNTDNRYPVDRFGGYEDTDGVMTAQRDTSAPSGFINSIKFTTTTADASLGASQFVTAFQNIEGLNVADLAWGTANAKTVTLSFWVRSSLTGTFGGTLTNSAGTRSYPFSYAISSADTWEQKTITVAGDTTGTWLTDNGIGIRVRFGLGAGSTFSGTAGAWTGSNLFSSTGAVSVIGTLNATWYITGVQLEVGSTATSFDYRPYSQELALCQRYYFKIGNVTNSRIGWGHNNLTTQAVINTIFPVSMRTSPTALEQSGTASDYDINHANTVTVCSSVPTIAAANQSLATTLFNVASGLTVGQASNARALNTSAYLAWSAEL